MTYELMVDQKYKPKPTKVQREVHHIYEQFPLFSMLHCYIRSRLIKICKLYQMCYVMSDLDNTSVLYQWYEIISSRPFQDIKRPSTYEYICIYI